MRGPNQEKLYFKIGEAAELLNVKPSVLRFWESQFPALSPSKSRSGQRLYNQQELALLREISQLLYGEKLTIEGARKRLTGRSRRREEQAGASSEVDSRQLLLTEIKQDLLQIKEYLER